MFSTCEEIISFIIFHKHPDHLPHQRKVNWGRTRQHWMLDICQRNPWSCISHCAWPCTHWWTGLLSWISPSQGLWPKRWLVSFSRHWGRFNQEVRSFRISFPCSWNYEMIDLSVVTSCTRFEKKILGSFLSSLTATANGCQYLASSLHHSPLSHLLTLRKWVRDVIASSEHLECVALIQLILFDSHLDFLVAYLRTRIILTVAITNPLGDHFACLLLGPKC